jgi:hypothetical protein
MGIESRRCVEEYENSEEEEGKMNPRRDYAG